MRRPQSATVILIGTVVLLVGSLVLAAVAGAGDGGPRKVEEKKLVLMVDGEHQTITLDDLKDGESRTFTDAAGTTRVTRTGDRLDVVRERNDGTTRTFALSGAEDDQTIVVRSAGDGGEVKEIRLHGHGDRMLMLENGHEVDIDGLEHLENLEKDGKRVIVRRAHGHGDHAFAFATGDGPVWFGADEGVVLRCEQDQVTLSGPTSLKERTVACPVCGRPMTEVEGTRVKVIRIKTEDAKAEQK